MTLIIETQKWLETQGFPLEMRTAAEFRKAGFEVRQSRFYLDPETGKSREIDVEAFLHDIRGVVDIRFIVECKAAKKPWILLCSPDTLRNYNRTHAFASISKVARHILVDHLAEDFDRFVEKIPWFGKEGLIGYSLRQAHSEKDSGYEAAISVAKACHAFVHASDKTEEEKSIIFGFPVIVIDGPLIQCSLAQDGQLQLEEVEQGEFLFRGNEFGTCIRVVTAKHLPAFALEAKSIADRLRVEFKSDGDQIADSWGKGSE